MTQSSETQKSSEQNAFSSVNQRSDKNTGLILIQIDGLSRNQFQKAINSAKMPFLKKLLNNKGYTVHSFYSGLPSSTPAVQAELFYGVKCAVPSFGFINRKSKEFYNMLSSRFALRVQKELAEMGRGLLTGGSAYSDCYTGGASRASFCATSIGFGSWWLLRHPFNFLHFMLIHWLMFLRIALLMIFETGLAIFDLFKGLISRENFFSELNFVPTRVGICVLLRELVVTAVSRDIRHGVPIIHCNFLGYDEQSHRRGPSSRFAHWTLKGIDDAVRRIYCASQRSKKLNYSLWVYSDHGQESSLPYSKLFGKSIGQAISDVINRRVLETPDHPSFNSGVQLERGALLGKWFSRWLPVGWPDSTHKPTAITAVGPIGHIYLSEQDLQRKEKIALDLVLQANIPAVIFSDASGQVKAYTSEGCFVLPENADRILGDDHQFLAEATLDLLALQKNRYSGDLIIIGWNRGDTPLTFPMENGAHAGPGREETHGFVLTPADSPVDSGSKGYLRPLDLREAAFRYMES